MAEPGVRIGVLICRPSGFGFAERYMLTELSRADRRAVRASPSATDSHGTKQIVTSEPGMIFVAGPGAKKKPDFGQFLKSGDGG
jgi:hypothetical protein